MVFPSEGDADKEGHRPIGQRMIRRAVHATRAHLKFVKLVSRVSSITKVSPVK
jgi:hypothetical protein